MGDYDYPLEYNNFTDYEHQSEQGHLETSVIVNIVVQTVLKVIGLTGNITVVCVIFRHSRLRNNITNVYILQRTLTEGIEAITFPLLIMAMTRYYLYWNNKAVLMLVIFLALLRSFLSEWVLVLMTVDCYLASRPQHHSLQYRWKILKLASVVLWLAVTLLAVLRTLTLVYLPYGGDLMMLNHLAFWLFALVIPLIICWVYISFLYPPKSSRATVEGSTITTNNTNNTTSTLIGENEEGNAPLPPLPRTLILAVVTTATVLRFPTSGLEMLFNFMHNYIENVMVALHCIFEVCFAVNPFLYMWLQGDLRQVLMKSLPRRNFANILLESRS
ncbi:hypothetical protein Pcinc_034316 [Petrolisthes cinctipes]|uniref:G-protein coupled receptors family 1 profile domain-containing protein n=1 Tax=Petrolisthes cinctipes TaxID=88211 RepID=A0AAE1EQH3_PETCI|nr:hypothetical protein Pcinc_034316 [Petrolisthes cinctipes]